MKAGYIAWSYMEGAEIGECSVYVNVCDGNVICCVPGMAWNSADGKWRIDALQRIGCEEVHEKYRRKYCRKASDEASDEASGKDCGKRYGKDRIVWVDGYGTEHVFWGGNGKCDANFRCRRTDNGTIISDAGGNELTFSADGRLECGRTKLHGNVEYAYSGGRLTSVAWSGGRRIFGYEGNRLAVMAEKRVMFYEYANDGLTAVRFGDGAPGIEFEYSDGLLKGVKSGGEYFRIGYDKAGRAADFGGKRIAYFDGYSEVYSEADSGAYEFEEAWRYEFDVCGRLIRAINAGNIWRREEDAKVDICESMGI